VTGRTKAPYSFLMYIILQITDPEGVLKISDWYWEVWRKNVPRWPPILRPI